MDDLNNQPEPLIEPKFKILSTFVLVWTILQFILDIFLFGGLIALTIVPIITIVFGLLAFITISLLITLRSISIKKNYTKYIKTSTILLWLYLIITVAMVLLSLMFITAL